MIKLITPKYQKYRLQIRCKNHPIYKKALRVNYTPLYIDFQTHRLITFLQNIILSIFGETGTGKSYVGWTLGESMTNLLLKFYPGLTFTEDNVYLDIAKLEERLKEAHKGETFMLDEQVGFFGTGSQYILTTLQNIEMTCRNQQINLIYCAPCVRTHYHNHVLETFMVKWPEQRTKVGHSDYIPFGKTYCFVYDQQSKSYLDPLGHIIVNHPKNIDALIAYEKKKEKYNRRVLRGDAINIAEIRNSIIKKFRETEQSKYCKSKKDIKIVIKMLGIIPDGAPNTFLEEIAHQIKLEDRILHVKE